MKNTIYTDADLNAELLRGEEYDGNTIEIVIDADNTPDQVLTIAAGTTTIAETITPGTRNTIDIPQMIWNFGGDTKATLTKDGTDAETITITFPAAIDAGAGLNENGTNAYKMDGSASLQDQIVSLQNQVETFSMQTLDYILPKTISQADITDGSSNTALTFEFEVTDEGGRISLFTSLQFLAGTTVTGSTFDDLNVTGTIELDGNPIATILHTYRDGRQLFTLDYLVENLTKGNHTVTVAFAAAGGSMTVMQFLSAFMLAAKSTGSGSTQIMPLYTNGEFMPGVLLDGFDASKISKEAYINGVIDSAVKALKSTMPGVTPNIEDLNAYFLTDYCLATEMRNARLFYTDLGMITRDTITVVGDLDTHFYIPIKRISGYNRISCMAKCEGEDHPFSGVLIYAAAIVDGEMERPAGISYTMNLHNWTEITFDISALPYVDYIVVAGAYGKPCYKDIKLLKV